MEHFVTIELFGRKNIFEADAEIPEAQKIADYLAGEVAKIETEADLKLKTNKLSMVTIAALNIAHEYMKLKTEHDDLLKKFSEQSGKLMETLNHAQRP